MNSSITNNPFKILSLSTLGKINPTFSSLFKLFFLAGWAFRSPPNAWPATLSKDFSNLTTIAS